MIIEKLNLIILVSENDSNEYLLSSYFLNHADSILNLQQKKVINEIGVSKSTIDRYCKNFGLKNYTEFKYQLNQDLTSIKSYHPSYNDNDETVQYLIPLLNNKKRIIVLGDSLSLSTIAYYRPYFAIIGIPLEFKLTLNETNTLKQYKVNKDDLIIYLSLKDSNLSLMMNMFNNYQKLITYLDDKNLDYIFIGQLANDEQIEKYNLKIESTNSIPKLINQVTTIFDKIYYICNKRLK
ncbi:MAG: hypothetical protein PHH04_01525 [Thomasclavelia sp.]|nr:hypothetical protein [Thomasclavelia sp.]